MFGHPASAADVKHKGNGWMSLLALAWSEAASMALKAVSRVIASYVDPESGNEPDPEANRLY